MKALNRFHLFAAVLVAFAVAPVFGFEIVPPEHLALIGLLGVMLPDGSQIAVASTFGTSKTMSAITNATEAVATLEASHGVIENDILVVTSGWARLNSRVVRADSVATNDVTFEDIDTSNTVYHPAGSGTGSIKEVTAWQALSNILDVQTTGGDPRNATYQFLDEFDERSLPSGISAKRITFTFADDQSVAWWTVLRAISAAKTPYPLRITLPNGNVIYRNGVWHFDEDASFSRGQVMAVSAVFDAVAPLTRYSA